MTIGWSRSVLLARFDFVFFVHSACLPCRHRLRVTFSPPPPPQPPTTSSPPPSPPLSSHSTAMSTHSPVHWSSIPSVSQAALRHLIHRPWQRQHSLKLGVSVSCWRTRTRKLYFARIVVCVQSKTCLRYWRVNIKLQASFIYICTWLSERNCIHENFQTKYNEFTASDAHMHTSLSYT